MSHCKVYGTKPDNGPGQLAAQAARDRVNQAHAAWAVTLAYNSGTTTAVYTSAVASVDDLEKAFEAEFPQYTVVGY
ncbi:MAG: hypothetical protein ACTHNO_03450 [Ralstonia sp.]|uniref:Uncharacterized protein n=1 Tax=Ralstonia chuxiongensis TaxID=2957504 RepID=A0AA42BMZ2_9RALS|nr:hypothetical protein [Ralstonia chuxiongensis]MCP1175457.1 hypothetical protein [Ralstonia chuxiongensis]